MSPFYYIKNIRRLRNVLDSQYGKSNQSQPEVISPKWSLAKYPQDAERLLKLSQTKDEALTHAIVASELYMKAIVLAKLPAEKSRLKQKCLEAIDRAEEIKKIDQWPVFDLSRDAKDKSKKLVLRAPISTRALLAREKLIILKSSRLHGSVFPQWTQKPQRDDFSAVKGLYL